MCCCFFVCSVPLSECAHEKGFCKFEVNHSHALKISNTPFPAFRNLQERSPPKRERGTSIKNTRFDFLLLKNTTDQVRTQTDNRAGAHAAPRKPQNRSFCRVVAELDLCGAAPRGCCSCYRCIELSITSGTQRKGRRQRTRKELYEKGATQWKGAHQAAALILLVSSSISSVRVDRWAAARAAACGVANRSSAD
jgi:hypothetical protein